MALDFPSSPVDGQVYDNFYYDAAKGTWKSLSSGASPNYLVSPTITNAVITATAPNASTIPLTVNGAASQSANLQEWKNSTGTNIAYINSSGHLASKALTVFSSAGAKSFGVGDDPSGQIELGREDGVASSPYIDFHSGTTPTDYDSRIQANGGTGVNGKGNLSLFGTILTPDRPAFEVRNSASAAGGGSNIVWNLVDRNNGNHYNTANGRFTAPIAGVYHFDCWGLWPNANSGDFRIAFYKNDTGYQGARFITWKIANTWQTFFLFHNTYLNAGDYITVRVEAISGAIYTDASYNGFTGYLVG